MSVIVEYAKRSEGEFILMHGTKVFLSTGEEVKNVTRIGMPEKGVNDILEVTLTITVADIKVV